MASNLIAVEVAAGQAVITQGRTWLEGCTVWLPADDVPNMLLYGIVVPVGTFTLPVLGGG